MSRSNAVDFPHTQPAADLAIVNGRIWTGSKSQPVAEALASRGEHIVAAGSNNDIRNLVDSKTWVIDLQGKLGVMRAFRVPTLVGQCSAMARPRF